MLNKYGKIIHEQLSLKIIEKVNNFDKLGETHFLPHKAVITDEKETTKIWVAFDVICPRRKGKPSLNDILHAEPPLTSLLFDVMGKFGSYNYAIVSDTEKVFLQKV